VISRCDYIDITKNSCAVRLIEYFTLIYNFNLAAAIYSSSEETKNMKRRVKGITIVYLISTSINVISIGFAATPAPRIPANPPNEVVNITRRTGNCPQKLDMWTTFRYYEGGGEHTVIANTISIAGKSKLVSSGKKFVEYQAPLKKTYISCVGYAIKDNLYFVKLQKGKISFRIVLPKDTPSNPSAFSLHTVVDDLPYVKWQIAD
jgi:hypothetical protein